MKLPKQIKVASQIYKVEIKDEAWYHESGHRGTCDHNKNIIRIANVMNESRTYETFLHEILHAIYYEYDLHDEDKEERIVTAMATGMSQVLKDNPSLAKWLLKDNGS